MFQRKPNVEISVKILPRQYDVLYHRSFVFQLEEFIFTRTDAEHNQKILKTNLRSNQLSKENVYEVAKVMKEYLSIPIRRWAHLTKRYLHYCRMKEIGNYIQILIKQILSCARRGNFFLRTSMSFLFHRLYLTTSQFDWYLLNNHLPVQPQQWKH